MTLPSTPSFGQGYHKNDCGLLPFKMKLGFYTQGTREDQKSLTSMDRLFESVGTRFELLFEEEIYGTLS